MQQITGKPFRLIRLLPSHKCVVLLSVYADAIVTSDGAYALNMLTFDETPEPNDEVYFNNSDGLYYLPVNYAEIPWSFSDDTISWTPYEQQSGAFIDFENKLYKHRYKFARCKVADYERQ